MEMNLDLQTKNIIAASFATRAEDDVFMVPISHQPLYIQIQEGHRSEDNGRASYPPSPLLWVPVNPPIRSIDQLIGAMEKSDHIALTVPEPQIMDHTTLTVPEPQNMDHTTLTVPEPQNMDHTTLTVPESQMEHIALTVPECQIMDRTALTVGPESRICRICAFDEEEEEDDDDYDLLVELGCSCKGEMSRMHRKCILKWYGVRMLLEKLYKCELCNTVLHPKAQLIVARGVTDHENGGRAILMEALKSSLASYAPQIEVERAANYEELVQLLLDERAEWYRHRRQVVVHIEAAQAVNSNSPQQEEEGAAQPVTVVPPACGRGPLMGSIAATVVSVGLYAYLLIHLYRNAGYS